MLCPDRAGYRLRLLKAHPANLDSQALLAEIIGHLNAATDNAIQLVKAAVQYLADNPVARAGVPKP